MCLTGPALRCKGLGWIFRALVNQSMWMSRPCTSGQEDDVLVADDPMLSSSCYWNAKSQFGSRPCIPASLRVRGGMRLSITSSSSAMVAAEFQITLALMSNSRHRAEGTSGHFGPSLYEHQSNPNSIDLHQVFIPEVLGLLWIGSTVDTAYSILQGVTTKSNYGYGPTWRWPLPSCWKIKILR